MTADARRTPLDAEKATVRAAALARRDALPAERRVTAAAVLARRPLPVAVPPAAVVSGYVAIRSELDPLPLMRAFVEAGASLALPVTLSRGKPLVFRAWREGEPLDESRWGLSEPTPAAPEVAPDILLVPLAAFDRRGHRIGYGAGFYDRTLDALRAKKPVVAIGLAFACQECPRIPVGPFDAPLDLVLTETAVHDFRQVRRG
ncbi:5-formyltetrahydrofolate cyclo-ligase [Rhodovulum sp. PH10]|uniref:5-formyltetrahydrofolate cyclo-ligase n=1 Tax=Rhodovulum sp. PH10 TaxID=1187851 RepID=UPI00027C1DBF|nr:5-formyltetrahydrofolate cyclo-ligase [Rhodovulum sp. PH10]EJW12890.1 5-formyltetrahydrofolate cyclo-ligase [Rhodovulum sp. PH10]